MSTEYDTRLLAISSRWDNPPTSRYFIEFPQHLHLERWSGNFPNPDATLFTVFLNTLNNTYRDDETIVCGSNADCKVANGGSGGACGFGGFRDWCIPNVKRLESIADNGTSGPTSSVPGRTASSNTPGRLLRCPPMPTTRGSWISIMERSCSSLRTRKTTPAQRVHAEIRYLII